MENINNKWIAVINLFVVSLSLSLLLPGKAVAATLTAASATLSNPRLSYRANTTVGTSGTSAVTVAASGYPDNNTNHLFPGDSVCFTNQGLSGCLGAASYTVATVSGLQNFSTSSPLGANIDTNGFAISTQSGSITLTFTLVNTIPVGGNIFITVPVASTGNVNDGFPDTGTSNTTDGFDFNKLQSTNIQVSASGGTCTGAWTSPVVASASGTILIARPGTTCVGATVTVVIPNMVNPSPFVTNHTQGTADTYKISVLTRDGSNNVLDSTNVVVAPVEGVLVSANVDQTLSFRIDGVTTSSGSYCGVTRTATSIQSSSWAIPFGTLAVANSFYDAQQMLTVSTNADTGYTVTIEANDQMGLNGGVCTGSTAGEANNCIRDTACDGGSCTFQYGGNWGTATNNGLGYTLATVSSRLAGTFGYNQGGNAFYAKELPDQEASEAKQAIMTATAPVSADQVYVCYRLSISGTQPAGYYYNKVKYTATARF